MATRELTIATAPRRTTKQWTNTHATKQDLIAWAYDPIHVPHTQTEYHQLPKTAKDQAKDVGGFVAGHLKNGHRRKGHVLTRSVITLDIDYLPSDVDLNDHLTTTLGVGWLIHTTLSHTPETPRWRLWVWLDRDITADEYTAIARRLAKDINPQLDWFDPTTFEPERFMYKPSTTTDGDYHVHTSTIVAPDLNPDEWLLRYADWTDVTTWPGITPDTMPKGTGKVQDPRTRPGLIGAFNRAHTITQAIAEFLPEVYKPGTIKNRYTYTGGTSSNGLIVYDGDLHAYSQHATDPASETLCNAFDLVRIHRYGDLDASTDADTPTNKLPSYHAMQDFIAEDAGTRRENARATITKAQEVFTAQPSPQAGETMGTDTEDTAGKETSEELDWLTQLEVRKDGSFKDTIGNFHLIFMNDPRYTSIAWNSHSNVIEVQDPQTLPWNQLKHGWTDNDTALLKESIAGQYGGLYSPTKMTDALLAAATKRAFHPVRDYFNHLPEWDGIERLDTLLVDYLGAEDTAYTRAVTRKTLVAAVRRTFRPGTKFDQVLTLVGPQGVGKSTIFAKLAGQWFSDSLTITDMKDKTGAEKLAGNLIVELSELAGMRKTEAEPVKGFISRTEDKYRPAYGRTVEAFPRQCIIVGSTNAEDGFLRDPTGNRRWWVVHVTGDTCTRVPDITQETIDQVWAEAVHYEKKGETLYLDGEVMEAALHVQAASVEADDRTGLVQEYLDTPLPEHWNTLPLLARRVYLDSGALPENFGHGVPTKFAPRDSVSKIEIWAECFGRDPDAMRRPDSYDIASIMQQIDGWHDSGAAKRLPIYGKQRIYRKLNPAEEKAKKYGIDPDAERPAKG